MPEQEVKRPKRMARVSMQGMGADAFFNPPVTREEQEEDAQPASQDTSKTVDQDTRIPVEQDTGIPVKQQAGKTVGQDTSVPAEQYMKATYYIRPEQDLKLEQLRLARRQRGERVDKSALIREAIDLLSG